ncbi:hypothetical protein evm_005643 [Chilo suppressalis]|nr:hypothetical protein evm_005643 [Chilo suppressalis]
MTSRAQRILGLLVKNTVAEDKDSSFTYDSNKNNNKDTYLEVVNTKQVATVESHENFKNTFEMVTKSEDHCNKADLALTNSQREIKRPNISLGPYYDSDITISDNEDQTQFFTTEAESYDKKCRVRQLSSSSSSSCTSSSSSSSCSTSSSSDTLSSIHVINTNKANPLKYINTSHNDMTINETDAACSSEIKNISPQHLNLERLGLNRCTRDNLNYYTSPVYTDESDVDLSDSDPTFINIKPSKNRNYLINQSSSSSTSSSNSNRANSKKKGVGILKTLPMEAE